MTIPPMPPGLPAGEETRLFAAVDLVNRAGAKSFEFGYLHEDAPIAEAGWWAQAQYKGAKLMAEHHVSPGHAAEALALRLLAGATCKCGEQVALTDAQPGCRWKLTGEGQQARWVSGCDAPSIPIEAGELGDAEALRRKVEPRMNREQRRAFERDRRRGKV